MRILFIMEWNCQRPDWPNFTWEARQLEEAEAQFLLLAGQAHGATKHLSAEDLEHFQVDQLSMEAVTTSEIEGEVLDRASVQSSIRKQLGFAGPERKATDAERSVAKLMADLHRHFREPLTNDTLLNWHRVLMEGYQRLRDVGQYRTHPEPMQIVGRGFGDERIYFEAPPSEQVPQEMERWFRWFTSTAPGGDALLPGITRAGIAHIYFESIHPFEDGNGRIGRAISEVVLAQAAGSPLAVTLGPTLLRHRADYYKHLSAASRDLELTQWLTWFASIVLEAQQRTLRHIDFIIAKARLMDRLSNELNPRQVKALLRMFEEGPEGFAGGLSASNYMKITSARPATTTRDLMDLVEKDALTKTGELRHTRYHLNLQKPG